VKGVIVLSAAAVCAVVCAEGAFGVGRGNAGTRSVPASPLPARVVQAIRSRDGVYAFVPTWIPTGFHFQKLDTSNAGWVLYLARRTREKIRWGVALLSGATPCNGQVVPGARPYKAIKVGGHTAYWMSYTATTTPLYIGTLPEVQSAYRCGNTPSGVFQNVGGGSAGVVTEVMTAGTTDPASKLSPKNLARMVSSARWMGPPAQK
jgi:hypothetical protein